MKHKIFISGFFLLVLAAMSCGVLQYSIQHSKMLHVMNPRSGIVAVYNDTVERPYIHRQLVPLTARLVVALTPAALQENITQYLLEAMSCAPGNHKRNALCVPEYTYPVGVVLTILYTSLMLYGLGLRWLSLTCFPGRWLQAWVTAAAGLVLLLPLLNVSNKTYDFPAVVLSALCLLLLFRQRWKSYLACLAIATLNKDTALLQIGMFIVLYWDQLERRRFLLLLVQQCMIYGAIMGGIYWSFFDHEGFIAVIRGGNMVQEFFYYLEGHFITVAVIVGLVAWHWKSAPPMLKRAQWIVPANIALYLIFGWYGELRVLMDAMPAATLMLSHGAFSFGRRFTG